jgi:lysophospholipid acyltransferase (LPLAT)-like uncharacterized protein
LIAWIAVKFIRALHATLRVKHVRVVNIESVPQCIVAFWHSHLLLMLHARYRLPMTVMISRSKDGELIAKAVEYYGADSARGSTTRGGSAALRETLRAAQKGNSIAFTPDGPRGPARIAQEGVVYTAQSTGLAIVPVAFAAKKKSFFAPGTAWSFPCRSRKRSSSMERRSTFRERETSKSGGRKLKGR